MGNIPPRDVLASGTPEDVRNVVEEQFRSLTDTRRILFSCGGGMPPNAPTENIRAFVAKVKELSGR
jgi:uroporphyrinogen decarboxylase